MPYFWAAYSLGSRDKLAPGNYKLRDSKSLAMSQSGIVFMLLSEMLSLKEIV
jgi:hypothetical protein